MCKLILPRTYLLKTRKGNYIGTDEAGSITITRKLLRAKWFDTIKDVKVFKKSNELTYTKIKRL